MPEDAPEQFTQDLQLPQGVNNKIKLVSHRSYGFRNDDRYIEAIYHNCSALPLPPDS